MTANRWEAFWADRQTPEWRHDSEAYYRLYAGELRLLYQGHAFRRVLEVGCGDGALYPYLGFEGAVYRGVDFSQSMLAGFRQRHPGLDLQCAPGHTYRDGNVYDLIFSNGLVQYLQRSHLEQFLDNVVAMLAPAGVIVLGSVPWRERRYAFYTGALSDDKRRPFPLSLVRYVRRAIAGRVGYWYTLQEVRAMARSRGLEPEFFGSLVHLYRFHAVLQRSHA